MKKSHLKIPLQWIWATVLTLINLVALMLADPFQENISHIANVNAHPYFVLLWATSFALYLFFYIPPLLQILHYQKRMGRWLLWLSYLCMVASVILPYQPDEFPILADIHISLSTFATLLFATTFLYILYCGYFMEPMFTQKIIPYYLCIVGTCAMLYLLMGCVSTLLEAFFVISMGWYLCFTNRKKGIVKL